MAKNLSTQKVKEIFGDFSYTEGENGRINIDPAWVKENLVTVEIPQLANVTTTGGRVTFHKLAAHQLKNAFDEVERKGLVKAIITWNGSWVARHIVWNPKKALSPHSWGIAFDINVEWNSYGAKPASEGAYGTVIPLVPIFEAHGFCWGGSWKKPDGMHFEVAMLNPVTQFVKLIIDGVEVKDAEVVIRSNNRSYGLLGPIAKAIGVKEKSVIENDDPVPVAAFLMSHGYKVKWTADGSPKGTITSAK